uniref:Endoglucanase n=1 Tax=Panesthia cribrata TaxID=112953 RepID=Q9NCE3_PANCR|nr:beta-1,4-endoglucanase 1 [Panesthia cribrata]
MKMIIALLIFGCLAACQAATYDYAQVLQYSLLFYEAQRSGKLPADQKVTWRKDSALNDKGQNGEDLTGGYYDAGDFVKFGFPMAYTATVLAWGVISHEQGYQKANALEDARKAVKWATDYFIKAHVSENEFYGQVGRGDLDHNWWGRPEDMTMERPAYKIDAQHPGSDLAAETAAALAAASIVFKSVDPTYSNTLLTHAKQLYNFADMHRGKYSDSITDAAQYYSSYGYEDDLVWGAVWLYKATNDNSYLTKAEQYYTQFGLADYDGYFSWDQKISGVEVLLAEITKDQGHISRITQYCDNMVRGQTRTPKGLVYISDWGSLRMAANAVYLCLEAAKDGHNPTQYREFATQQIGYILGDTGKSYVVGFGQNYPTHESHRSSSCPDAPAACDWNTYNGNQPNAHVLYGALVGGPGQNDDYEDLRSDYVHNEVADDYNAAFQGALAALVELS